VKYTVKAAARASGVSVHRLRNWERRYGVPRPARSASGWRSYDEEDVALIRRMVAFVEAGLPASHAAEAAMANETLPQAAEQAAPPANIAPLAGAAARFDAAAVVTSVRRAVDDLGWADALDEALLPALRELGRSWESGEVGLASEHFTSELVRREILAAVSTLPPQPPTGGVALLACPEGERHDLALAGLWLLIAREGIPVVYLGADVPARDLVAAASAVAPAAICLSATVTTSLPMLSRATRELIEAKAPGRTFVGGAAVHSDAAATLPASVLPDSLAASAEAVVAECRSSAGSPV
jgi:methanogenic corrinoid protein MtbC1